MIISEADVKGFIDLGKDNSTVQFERSTSLTEEETQILEAIRKTQEFSSLTEGCFDRHSLRHLITKYVAVSPLVAQDLATKVDRMVSEGTLSLSTVLTEGVASSLSKEIGGEEKPGLGNKPSSPKGDADKGVDQKSDDHGDHKQMGGSGYAAEAKKCEQDDEDPEQKPDGDKEPEGKEPEDSDKEPVDEEFKGDKAVEDKARGQKGAELEKGKKQNEAQEHKPVASDPGVPAVGKHNKKPETVDAKTPDYSMKQVKKEDPSKSELNKGEGPVSESFDVIEQKLVEMLESAGYAAGSDEWVEMFTRGFKYAIEERAKDVAARIIESDSK